MMRPPSSIAPWAAVLLAGSAALGGCAATSTYGTGESPEMAILREISGGLGAPKKEPIDYQPRAPLVMPPAAGQLPAPVETAELADENWPGRSDVPPGTRYGSEKPLEDMTQEDYRRLKPLRLASNTRRKVPNDNFSPADDLMRNRGAREEFKAALDDAEGIGQTGRRYLTDPPETMREPAATAPAEFEEIKKKRTGFLSRLFTGG